MVKGFKKIGIFALSVLLGVLSAVPHIAFADDVTVSVGSPLSADGITTSNDYNDSDYSRLIWSAFWESSSSYFYEKLGYVPTRQQIYDYFDDFFSSYNIVWESQGLSPRLLANIFFYPSSNTFSVLVDICDPSSLNATPCYYSFTDDNISVTVSNYSVFYPHPTTDSFFLVLQPRSNENLLLSGVAPLSADQYHFSFSSDHFYFLFVDVPFDLSSFPSKVYRYSVGQVPLYNSENLSLLQRFPSYNGSILCACSSFPFYYSFKDYVSSYNQPFLSKRSFDYFFSLLFPSDRNPFGNGQFFFSMSDYPIFSEFTFNIFPTPTPLPTVLPTITPTPLPLAYDSSIDGMSDGSTLGFLDSLKGEFDKILSTFTGIGFVSQTIGYMYHYIPQFAFLWVVPLIAFLSFLLGRNKS